MWLRWFRRRSTDPAAPFPREWRAFLARIRGVAGLAPEERSRLEDRIARLVRSLRFEGCAGLVVTDEMKVVVAAHAALLSLHLPDDAFWKLDSVLLYPSSFVNPTARGDSTGVHHEGTAQGGEAWHGRGPVVLSWDDAHRSLLAPDDGHNVILHELAHKLDMLDGWADGTPRLHRREDFAAWREVMARERAELERALSRGVPTVLDAYAATDEAEFFAVATEAFFERPRALRSDRPDLYRCLAAYYRQDPASRAG